MKILKMGIYYCLFLLLIFQFLPIGDTAAIESEPRIDLATTPTSRLFTIENMKPGDWATRTITIENKGNMDFYYKMTSKYNSGSKLELDFDTLEPEDFYNQLLLKIEDSNGALYEGKLSNFAGLNQRFLPSFTSEDLKLSIEFPWESGNEYQGLAIEVVFTFIAEGKETSPPTDNPSDDPPSDDPPKGTPSDDSPKDPLKDNPPSKAPNEGTSIEKLTPESPNEEHLHAEILADLDVQEELSNEEIQVGLPSRLPQTGEINPVYFYIIGMFIMMIGFSLLMTKRKSKDKNRGV